MSFDFTNHKSFSDNYSSLEEIRAKNGSRAISLGIPFVDAAFRGMSRTDLCSLSGGTGVGKSEAGSHIAFHNAKLGKRVLYLALEAENKEFELRQLYKLFARRFFSDTNRPPVYISYTDFYFGRLENVFDRYAAECEEEFRQIKTFYTRYSKEHYTLQNLALDIENAKDFDLVVLDHLHFLYMENTNENQAFKEALMNIRSLVIEKEIPVILIAQLRKEASGPILKSVMPDISDIHGSSDIAKIITKAITLAPAGEVVGMRPGHAHIRPTLVRISKNRIDGSSRVYTGLMSYDTRTNSYDNDFVVGRLEWKKEEGKSGRVERFTPLDPDDQPEWIRKPWGGKTNELGF